MDELIKGPIMLLVILMGFFIFIGFEDSMIYNDGLNHCKDYLQNHGYQFVKYDGSGWFTHEECWGAKSDGSPVRVY